MDNSAIFVSENDGSASLTTLDFVEQVQSEEDVEIDFEEFRENFDFFNVSLELVSVLGVFTNKSVERVRETEDETEIMNELSKRSLEILQDGSPLIT